ncbi:hypothetical protein ABT390_31060 [Streptomyces aurantiacus]|uniref:ABM domain-containing protein n=1 Tax=Streptomyces aurantiacus JA 4570 TaxID=1286094 RepID=S4A1X1_9ACTN|nr:hypothetical protein [Streptomyces aurantiacus]EPH44730.1 hypothetical protein STRAU_2288 [Streptomyces aurantiacus JA 4570]
MTSHPSPQRLVTDPLPDILRDDAGHVLMSEGDVGDPARQRAVIQGAFEAWRRHPLPEGFLSRAFFAGTDGRTVLDYAQWTSAEAYRAFARDEDGQELVRGIQAAIGADTEGPGVYRLYRSMKAAAGTPGVTPGVVVRVAFDTDGESTARRLVDTIVDHYGGEQPPGDEGGGLASHFHIRQDGLRVVNYSEWTSEEAHQRMFEGHIDVEDGGPMAVIREIPGVRVLGFRRFLPGLGLRRP